jgi:cyclopropane-fatty-acyl-phospholipid synthase
MNPTLTTSVSDAAYSPTRADRWFRRRMLDLLAQLRGCEITLTEGDNTHVLGTPDASGDTLRCRVDVLHPTMFRVVALGGSVGVGESYMDGLWDCDDLTTLVRIFVRNRALLDRMETGLARLGGMLLRGLHGLNKNTRRGSRRNIAAHYDLGNDLFELFLDDNLMYSCAVFGDEHEALEVASQRKLQRICEKLQLEPDHHVVEIGTGWGGFALYAARHYGCRITTTTISREQYERAVARVREAGLAHQITVLQRDYRDLDGDGSYDRLVSIEMIEAIGHDFLPTYFAKCAALLKPDGMGLIQAITIEDHRYRQALKNVDFIQRYIFPGSFIPSISAMVDALGKHSDLKLYHLEDIGTSYALTLRHWRQRFNHALARVHELGYPERFVRMWNYYLSYCEGGFMERSIGDVQMLLVKPDCRREPYLPDLATATPRA